MKQTILLAILTFCFFTSNAFAQTSGDQILVQGNPPLTASMLEKSRDFFEFTFNGAMTETERATYQRELTKQWQNNDVGTIKTVQDLITLYDKISSGLSKEQLLAVQKELQAPLVNELRTQTGSDPLAKLLVTAFDRIQGLNAKQGGNLPQTANTQQQYEPAVSSTSVPQEILGEWDESHSSGTMYKNDYGNYSAPNGEKIILHLYPDGTYKGAYYVQSSMSVACTMNVFMPSTGVYSFDGNTLKLTEKTSRTISKDTCTARYNYEKDNKPGSYAYPARLESDQYGKKIVLTMNDGNHNFYFNTGKSFLGGR